MVDKSYRVNLVMNPDVVKQIDFEADKLCISRSAYINMAVTTYLQQQQVVRDMPNVIDALKSAQAKLDEFKALAADSNA